jgi:hypothetical protein
MAQVSEFKDDRKWYICTCLCAVTIVAVVVGVVVGTRPEQPTAEELHNSFCEEAMPIELGESVSGSTATADVVTQVDTCAVESFSNMTQPEGGLLSSEQALQ